jgi:hypothetical protein
MGELASLEDHPPSDGYGLSRLQLKRVNAPPNGLEQLSVPAEKLRSACHDYRPRVHKPFTLDSPLRQFSLFSSWLP